MKILQTSALFGKYGRWRFQDININGEIEKICAAVKELGKGETLLPQSGSIDKCISEDSWSDPIATRIKVENPSIAT